MKPDLESGAAPRVPGLFRRRRSLLLLLVPLLVVLGLYSAASPSSVSSTLRYVQDRVRPAPLAALPSAAHGAPPLAALPSAAHGAPPPVAALGEGRYEATEALTKLAKEHGVVLPGTPLKLAGAAAGPAPEPDAAAKLALFLRRIEDAAWTVPDDKTARQLVVSPSGAEAERSLREGRGGEAEAKEYVRSPTRWGISHQPGLVIFSKTYCPYSKKAKALLTKLGAKFEPVEVDLRSDSAAFKEALMELSGGHRTFPQIWIGGKFLGGSDDLALLNDPPLNVLHGMLQAAGVMG